MTTGVIGSCVKFFLGYVKMWVTPVEIEMLKGRNTGKKKKKKVTLVGVLSSLRVLIWQVWFGSPWNSSASRCLWSDWQIIKIIIKTISWHVINYLSTLLQTTIGPGQVIMDWSGLWPLLQPSLLPFILKEFLLKPAVNSWAQACFRFSDKT